MLENVLFENGAYTTKNLDIIKEGRYTLQLRVRAGKNTGYSNVPAYLKLTK